MANANTNLDFQVVDICSRENVRSLWRGKDLNVLCRESTYVEGGDDKADADEDDFDPFDSSELAVAPKSGRKEADASSTIICLFGKTVAGKNVTARINYQPFLFIEMPDRWTGSDLSLFIQDVANWSKVTTRDLPYTIERRKRAYGWIPEGDGSTTATFRMLRLRFPNEGLLRKTFYILRSNREKGGKYNLQCWEHNIKATQKFCDDQSVVPSGWVRLPAGSYQVSEEIATHSEIEVEVPDFHTVQPLPERQDMAPLVIASFDLECYSQDHAFPNALNAHDYICGIGTSLKRFGQIDYERHYFALKETKLAPEDESKLHLHWYPTEKEMFYGWRDWLMSVDPDVITGYNINIFDFHYLADRIGLFVHNEASRLFFMSRIWRGHTTLLKPDFSSSAYGQRQFYTFKMAGRLVVDLLEVIRREHKLRSYKLDAVASHFLPCTECKGDKVKMATCKLCGQTGRMHKIDLTPHEIFECFEGSPLDRGRIAVYCSMDCDLVLQLMTKLSSVQNIIEMSKVTLTPVQDIVSGGQQIKVFNQIIWYSHREGFVINDPQDVRLPHGYQGATVLDPKPGYYADHITVLDFASLYPSIMRQHNLCFSTWIINEAYKGLPGAKYHTVDVGPRKYTFITHIPGILPQILKTLLSARKVVKKQMEEEKDEFKKSLLDAKQLAIKVSCNSVYGFCGTQEKGRYPCLAVSDSTTLFGRQMIASLKEMIERKHQGAEVIYGDSVIGETPVLVQFEDGHLDVCSIDTLIADETEWSGTRGKQYASPRSPIKVWTEKGWTGIERVIRHKVAKPLFRVTTYSGSVVVTADHSLITSHGDIVTPAKMNLEDLLHSYPEILCSGRPSWFDQVASTVSHDTWNWVHGALPAAKMYYCMRAMGLKPVVQVDVDERDRYGLCHETFGVEINHYTPDQVHCVEMWDGVSPEYVYDLTTWNHHFQAGVGSLIVHNTDSVMVKFKIAGDHPTPIEECFRLGNEVAKCAHEMFGEVIDLTMEKVYHGYILLKKKRYAGLAYTDPKKPPKVKMSGVEAVRRDSCLLVCETYEQAVKALLIDRSVSKAQDIVQQSAWALAKGEVPIDKLVLSCQLKREYKNANQAQQVVVNKIRERAPGSEPKSGDRVQFVISLIKKAKAPLYMKVEDAVFARENKVPLDYLHYLESQLERPLTDLLEAFIDDPKAIFDPPRRKLQREKDKYVLGLQDIRQFMKALTAPATPPPTASIPKKPPVDLVASKRKRVLKGNHDPTQPSLFRKK